MKPLVKIVVGSMLGCCVLGGALIYADPKSDIVDVKAVATMRAQIQADEIEIAVVQAKAQKDKDLIKLNCVQDKVVQIKAKLNIADAIYSDLASGGDVGKASEYATTGDDIHKLVDAAKACVDLKRLSTEGGNSFNTNGYIPVVTDDGQNPDMENPGYASPDD